MKEKLKTIVETLTEQNKTVATMESCTGGFIVNAITNIEGASEILSFSAVTYSNQAKINMGVDATKIETYSVYSMEIADEMSKNITKQANSNYGIGVTGKLNRADSHNPGNQDQTVYLSLYDRDHDCYYHETMVAQFQDREKNKNLVLEYVIGLLQHVL